MDESTFTVAQQLAQAASAFQQRGTGNVPKSVAVVMSDDLLVIALHDALSPAERAMTSSPAGAIRVQEFHRQSFNRSVDVLRQEIKRITGVEVREAVAEVEPSSGTIVHAFTTGTVVQVFLLAGACPQKPGAEATRENRGEAGGSAGLGLSRISTLKERKSGRMNRARINGVLSGRAGKTGPRPAGSPPKQGGAPRRGSRACSKG